MPSTPQTSPVFSQTEMLHAVISGNLPFVLQNPFTNTDLLDYALKLSFEYGHIALIQHFITLGAKMEDADYAIEISAKNGYLDVVKYLLQPQHALLHIQHHWIKPPRFCAETLIAQQGQDAPSLLEKALFASSRNGHLPIIQLLMEHSVHADDDKALRLSAAYGHLPVVQYFIEHGADVHASMNASFRASATNQHHDVMCFLLEHGADLHVDFDYALRYNAYHGNLETVKLLISYGAIVQEGIDAAQENSPTLAWLIEHQRSIRERDILSTTDHSITPHLKKRM